MNDLQIFNNAEFGEIRTVVVDDEPMFCLADICKALEMTNPSNVLKRLEEDERTILSIGRQGETWFVNESGLYTTILRSDKPEAKKFRKWVTSEVLPSIRKTGGYNVVDISTLTPELQMAKALLDAQIKQQQQINAIETRVDNICDILTEPIGDWKNDINKKVRSIAQNSNIDYQNIWYSLYGELETRAGCNLKKLVDNKTKRMTDAGNTKSAIKEATTKLAVIHDNRRLKEIFTAIVREWSVKYCA